MNKLSTVIGTYLNLKVPKIQHPFEPLKKEKFTLDIQQEQEILHSKKGPFQAVIHHFIDEMIFSLVFGFSLKRVIGLKKGQL